MIANGFTDDTTDADGEREREREREEGERERDTCRTGSRLSAEADGAVNDSLRGAVPGGQIIGRALTAPDPDGNNCYPDAVGSIRRKTPSFRSALGFSLGPNEIRPDDYNRIQ